MAFSGFNAEGIDLLIMNRLQNNKEFYEQHKDEIREKAIEPFYELIEEMKQQMLLIDPNFVTVPNRMVSRVRRDNRFTKDKSLYRANLWLFFRRARKPFEHVPSYYVEIHPEYWAYGCWGGMGKGEMEEIRAMILREDKIFLDAYKAVNACKEMTLEGELYKRPKFPEAKAEYQTWLNRKQLGVNYNNNEKFESILDGSFVPNMLKNMNQIAPFYRLLWTAKERAATSARVMGR